MTALLGWFWIVGGCILGLGVAVVAARDMRRRPTMSDKRMLPGVAVTH